MALEQRQAALIAQQLMKARRARAAQVSVLPAQGASSDDAYRVQTEFCALLQSAGAGTPAGWKIALTSPAMQNLVGVDEPLGGVVYQGNVHRSGAVIGLGEHQHLGVEFEVAVCLGEDVDGRAQRCTRAGVAPSVAACATSFELVDDRNADYSALDGFSIIAENAWNAGVVLGARRADWRSADLVDAVTRLWIDGEVAGQGRAGDALGHPLEAVAWLANLKARQGEVLPAGSFVMTGSSITTRFPAAGEHYCFEIEGLGRAEVRFE